MQMMALESPININKRYEHVEKLYPQETVGEGLKQVHPKTA